MLTHQEWLTERKKGIGGSDIAAIFGLNPYRTPYDIWLDKTNRADLEPDNIAMRVGRKQEQVIAELFEEETGKKVHRVNEARVCKSNSILRANIDRKIEHEKAILECKNTNCFQTAKEYGIAGSDIVPTSHLFQCMHYMTVFNYPLAYLAALILGDFKIYVINFNAELSEIIQEKATYFWETYVIPDTPPPPTTLADLQSLYRTAKIGSAVEATQIETLAIEEIKSIKSTIKDLEKSLEEKEFVIKSYLKDNEILTSNGKPIATYKGLLTSRFDSKQFLIDDPVYYAKYLKESPQRKFLIK